MRHVRQFTLIALTACVIITTQVRQSDAQTATDTPKVNDAKNRPSGKQVPQEDPELQQYGIYQKTAPRAGAAKPIKTSLPLSIHDGARVALIGNMLLERSQHFGHLETLLHQRYPNHRLIIRNLAWPADTPDLQPRPDNFADIEQHLVHEKIDIIFASFGFNESFDGPGGIAMFKTNLTNYVNGLKTKSFNGESAPQIVLISPIANENIRGVPAGDRNNANIQLYADAVGAVAAETEVGFVDVFQSTAAIMRSPGHDLTINGVHLNEAGYQAFANMVYQQVIGEPAGEVTETIRQTVIDKNRQYFRRYRPLNTFYYTGGRSKT